MQHVIEHLRKELVDGRATKKRNAVASSDIKNGEIIILKKVRLINSFSLYVCVCSLCTIKSTYSMHLVDGALLFFHI